MPIDPSIPLAAKTYQTPDVVGIANNLTELQNNRQKNEENALNLQVMREKIDAMHKDAYDSAVMSSTLKQLNPNDPDYDTKAIDAMHAAGVSPEKIAAFKKNALADQLQTANVDEKKAQAAKVKEDTISKFNENQVFKAKQTNDMMAGPLKDTLDLYDQQVAKLGPNPSPSAVSTAKSMAEAVFKSHSQAILDSMDPKDPMYNAIKAEVNKPFSIDSIRGHYQDTQQSNALLQKQKDALDLKKTQAGIQREQDQTSIERARLGEEIREHRAQDADRGKQVVQSIGPDGKPVFTIIDKGTGTAKETTEVVAPKGGGQSGGRESVMLGRQLNALAEGTKALENISESPTGSSKGFLGSYEPGHGIAGTTLKNLSESLTSDEAKSYNVMTAGLSRAAATMETSGLAPAGSLTKQLHDAIEILPTDSKFVAMRKLAEARQILQEPIKNLKANPSLTADQKQEVDKFDKRLNDAVPYTQHDLTVFNQKGKGDETFADYAKKNGLGGDSGSKDTPKPTKSLDEIFK